MSVGVAIQLDRIKDNQGLPFLRNNIRYDFEDIYDN